MWPNLMPVIFKQSFNVSVSTSLSQDIKFPKYLQKCICSIILLFNKILLVIGFRPQNAISFVFCTDIIKSCSAIILFHLYAASCKLPSVLDTIN